MKWQTITSKQLWQDKWQEVCVDTYQTPSGKIGEWLIINKKNDGAAIIARNDSGEVALVSNYRYPVDDQIWQVPLEAIESIEDDMSAAQRGAKEELGVWAETIEKLGECYIDPGTMKQKMKVFLLTNLQLIQQKLEELEEEMIAEVAWFTYDAIKQMIQERKIRDAWTLAAFQLYDLSINGQQKEK